MRTFSQRIFYVAWFMALFLLLPACSLDKDHDAPPATDAPGNILRFDVDYDFGSFNPHKVDCSGSTYVFPFIYSYLFMPNTEGGLEPDLATAWNYDPKIFTWRIRLRRDALFHNGDPLTADDVLFSIRSTTENRNKSLGNIIASLKAIDTHELEIRMKQDVPELLDNIWDMEIIPSPACQAYLNTDESPIGSGHFKFVEHTADGQVILAANENYYNGRPAIDQVIFYYIQDREASWLRLIKGDTDIADDLTLKDYKIIKQYSDRFYFSIGLYPYYKILLYNTHHPLFENPQVRRALTQAIDRDYMVQCMLDGMAEVTAGPMGNKSAGHDPNLKPLPYNPSHALALLEKAGWTLDPQTRCLMKNGKCFEFELLLPSGNETDLKIARYIQLCLNDVGIRVHLRSLTIDELLARYFQNTAFQAVLTSLSTHGRRPEQVLNLWVKTEETRSIAGGFDSPEAARLAHLALNAKDPETRQIYFQQFDRLIADLAPGSFLFQKTYIDAMSRRFVMNGPFSFGYPGLYRITQARLKNQFDPRLHPPARLGPVDAVDGV